MGSFFGKADPNWWIDEGEYFKSHSKFWFDTVVKILPRNLILDIGCGPGRFTIPLANNSYRVVAADLNPRMLEIVQKRASIDEIRGKIDLLVCDGQNLPFRMNTFDLVNLIGTFIHIPDQQRALLEICRIVDQEGYTAIDHTNYLSIRYLWDVVKYYTGKILNLFLRQDPVERIFCKFGNLWSFKSMFFKTNFSIIDTSGFQIFPFLPLKGQFSDVKVHLIPFVISEKIDKKIRGSILDVFAYNILVVGKKSTTLNEDRPKLEDDI